MAMCTYNGARFLSEQLESIAVQTRLPDELVVCDDGSVDDSRGIIRSFAGAVSFPVRLHVNDRTLGSTKNFEKAIGLCAGDTIVLSDQDDVWHPNKLRSLENALLSSPDVGLVFSNAEVVDEALVPLGHDLWSYAGFTRRKQRLVREGRPFDVLMRHNVGWGTTLAFRAEFRDCILPIPSGTWHDLWITLIVASMADLTFIEASLVKYRQHSSNQVLAGRLKRSSQLRRAFDRLSGEEIDASSQIYDLALERVSRFEANGVRDDVTRQLENKVQHLSVRADISRRGLARLPLIFREAISGRYHRYSRGWRSFVKDLLVKGQPVASGP